MTPNHVGPERRNPPDRRAEDTAALKQLDEGFGSMRAQLAQFIRKSLMAFAVLGLSCAIALLGFGMVLRKQNDITNRIQEQRYSVLVQSCKETNDRNKDVNSKIDAAVAQIPDVPPGNRAKAKKSAKPFRLIISAAVPVHKDCKAYAKQRLRVK